MKLPFSGIRILSLAEQYPGPCATMLLADLGADVIMVERPGSGDPSRRFAGLFASFNRNKRSVVLDLKSAVGTDEFLRLVETADMVMEGFRPGVMSRLKICANELRARKPRLPSPSGLTTICPCNWSPWALRSGQCACCTRY